MPSMPSVPLISARPSFSASTSGVDAGLEQGVLGADAAAVAVEHLALAHQRERDGGQRREVAGAAERAVLGHDRDDAGVEQVGQRLHDGRPDAGAAGGQRAQPQQHQRPHDLGLDRPTGAGGVRADQRPLQRGPPVGRDVPGGQRAEAGGDAVGRGRRVGEPLDVGPRDLATSSSAAAADVDGRAAPGDRDDLLAGQRPAVDHDLVHGLHPSRSRARRTTRDGEFLVWYPRLDGWERAARCRRCAAAWRCCGCWPTKAGPVTAACGGPRAGPAEVDDLPPAVASWWPPVSSRTCRRSAGTGSALAAFELGSAYLRHDPLERLARPVLRRADRARTGHTAQLGVLHGRETLYLLREQPPHPHATVVTDVGVRLPAQLPASGRAMLGLLPACSGSCLVSRPLCPPDRARACPSA